MTERRSWKSMRSELLSNPEVRASYDATRIRFELGEAVRNRREELGLTQSELARRAGLKQPAVARLEMGGTMPSIPTLERIAEALQMRLNVRFEPLRTAS